MTVNDYSIDKLLGADFMCSCGRQHSTRFSEFGLRRGAVEDLPAVLAKTGYKKPFLISDTHTEAAAGRKVKEVLKKAGITFGETVLKSPSVGDLPADEKALGSVAMAFDTECDFIISIGSGTINDLGRYFSYITGRQFMLVATAPSMDGLVSGVAPLITNNMKKTYNAQAPVALICDLDIMTQAPLKMLSAGAADILGKLNCLTDWRLSSIINGEYYCNTIRNIMGTAIDKTVSAMKTLNEKNDTDVTTLAEALTLSGMAMDFAGNSRPASGAEHHLSHYFEMQFLFDGKPAVLHGTKVGIGTVMTLRLYNELARSEKPDFDKLVKDIPNRMSKDKWIEEMHRCYRDGAEAVISLEEKAGKNDPVKLEARLRNIEAHWDEIVALEATVPASKDIQASLKKLGAATVPADVDIDVRYVSDAVMYAKELRDRYTILQLLWDIDRLGDARDLLLKEYC